MLHGQANVSLLSHLHHTVATAALCAAAFPLQMVTHSQSRRTLKLSSGSSISVDSAMRGENQFRGRSEAPNCKSGEKKEKGSFLFFFLFCFLLKFVNSCCHCGNQRDAFASLGFYLSDFSVQWLLRCQTMASIQGRKSWNYSLFSLEYSTRVKCLLLQLRAKMCCF